MTRSFRFRVLSGSLLCALGAVACGGVTRGSPHSAEQVSGPTPPLASAPALTDAAGPGDYASSEKSEAAPAAAPSAPRAASADAGGAYRPAPERREERPGLGTEWGETRESRVSSAPFERRDASRPFSTTSFFYNDEPGLRAMLGASYWQQQSDGIGAAEGAITIRVIDERGAALPTFSSAGQSFVLGEDGARYAIRIENSSGARFEAVTTVDGLDVIDGQPGSFEKRGYLVAPWSSVEIDGFRRSEDEVAAFRFGKVRDSYAAKRGRDRNVGVIGVAVFAERGASYPWTPRELERRGSADAFPGRFAPAP